MVSTLRWSCKPPLRVLELFNGMNRSAKWIGQRIRRHIRATKRNIWNNLFMTQETKGSLYNNLTRVDLSPPARQKR